MTNIQDGKVESKGRVQKIIISHIQDLSKVQFFHVKRKNNTKADIEANQGSHLKQGEISFIHLLSIVKWSPCFQL